MERGWGIFWVRAEQANFCLFFFLFCVYMCKRRIAPPARTLPGSGGSGRPRRVESAVSEPGRDRRFPALRSQAGQGGWSGVWAPAGGERCRVPGGLARCVGKAGAGRGSLCSRTALPGALLAMVIPEPPTRASLPA